MSGSYQPHVPLLTSTPDDRDIQDRNQAEIFATILMRGPISRADVAALTRLSHATVTKTVALLLKHRFVREASEDRTNKTGRPAKLLQVNQDRLYAIGIKIPGQQKSSDTAPRLLGVVTNLGAKVVTRAERQLESTEPEAVVRDIAILSKKLLSRRPEYSRDVKGLGVELGGHIAGEEGRVRHSPNLDWSDVQLGAMLQRATGLPVVVENDVNAIAVYEQWFEEGRRDNKWFAVVWVENGVGCGLVMDNQLVHGGTGGAGELGHIRVQGSLNARTCRCGKLGCLETLVSIPHLLGGIAESGGPHFEDIAHAGSWMSSADPSSIDYKTVHDQFERAGRALGQGLASLVNIVNPLRVILSGPGVVPSKIDKRPVMYCDIFMEAMQASFEDHAFKTVGTDCKIVAKHHPSQVGAIGAASTVLRNIIAHPLKDLST